MRILCIGDVVSREGVEILERSLPRLRREFEADAVIVNGENSALGNGVELAAYEAIMAAGADVVTGGNHSFQKKSAFELHEEQKRIIRPANATAVTAGRGELTLDFGRERLRVINLSGSLYMSECENPFGCVQRLLQGETDNRQENYGWISAPDGDVIDTDAVTVVDFHAEATSEKRALGFFLDGRVSLVFGTHTHVQTNDAQILPCGTGYITDIGMTGVKNAVLGKSVECCVHNFRYPDERRKITDGKGRCILSGIFANIDPVSKKCTDIRLVSVDK